MNNKGFTLIELIASILLLAIITSIATVSVVSIMESSKEKSYELLVDNIKIAAQEYFEECEGQVIFGNNEDDSPEEESMGKHDINCDLNGDKKNDTEENKITLKLNDLLTYGFLKSSATDDSGKKIVENPKTNEDISTCSIIIRKITDSTTYTTSYSISADTTESNCNIFDIENGE